MRSTLASVFVCASVVALCPWAAAQVHGNCCLSAENNRLTASYDIPPHKAHDNEDCYRKELDWIANMVPITPPTCTGTATCPHCTEQTADVVGCPSGVCGSWCQYSVYQQHTICPNEWKDITSSYCTHNFTCAHCEHTFSPPW